MSVFFVNIKFLFFFILSVHAGEVKKVEGILQYSFNNQEYIFYDDKSVHVVDGSSIDKSMKEYLDRHVNSGKKLSLGVDSSAIKFSWDSLDRVKSKVIAEKKDDLQLSGGRSLLSGTNLFSWNDDYFLIQINDDFYQILMNSLPELQKTIPRFAAAGEKINMVINNDSLVKLKFLSQQKMKENVREEYILIQVDKVYIVGKVLWMGSDALACVESKGKYFVFDKNSVDSEYGTLLNSEGANISIGIDAEGILAVFDRRGLIDKAEFFGQKDTAMHMRAR